MNLVQPCLSLSGHYLHSSRGGRYQRNFVGAAVECLWLFQSIFPPESEGRAAAHSVRPPLHSALQAEWTIQPKTSFYLLMHGSLIMTRGVAGLNATGQTPTILSSVCSLSVLPHPHTQSILEHFNGDDCHWCFHLMQAFRMDLKFWTRHTRTKMIL